MNKRVFKISRFDIAILLLFSAGVVPFIVGLYFYIKNILIIFDPVHHIMFTNLICSGFSLMVLSFFGIQNKNKMSKILYFIILFWIGMNDLYSFVYFKYNKFQYVNIDYFPFPIFPLFLGLIGLILLKIENKERPN